MTAPLARHQAEIERNRHVWESKPLLRDVYARLYQHLLPLIDPSIPGPIVEIGSGVGSLKSHLPHALATDLFPNPWLDLCCDAYELPFRNRSVSHLVILDVFHHLRAPAAFLREARRVLAPAGRLLLLEPYISLLSFPIYGLLHPEPVGWRKPILLSSSPPARRDYYAAQGNATRLFFRRQIPDWPPEWQVIHNKAFSCFYYFLSGGFSRPALFASTRHQLVADWDRKLSRWPRLFAGRCVVALRPAPPQPIK